MVKKPTVKRPSDRAKTAASVADFKKEHRARVLRAEALLQAVEDLDTAASRTEPRIHHAAGHWWGHTVQGDRSKNESLERSLLSLAVRVRS